jgi:hypothetical protein
MGLINQAQILDNKGEYMKNLSKKLITAGLTFAALTTTTPSQAAPKQEGLYLNAVPLEIKGAYISLILVPIFYKMHLSCFNLKTQVLCRYRTNMDMPDKVLFRKDYGNAQVAYQVAVKISNVVNLGHVRKDKNIYFGTDTQGNPVFKLIQKK